jgi:hypothetical protein
MYHLVVYAVHVSQPSSSGGHDLAVGVAVALVAMGLIVRYFKAILFLLAVMLLTLLFVGILEIEPLIVQIIGNARSTGTS